MTRSILALSLVVTLGSGCECGSTGANARDGGGGGLDAGAARDAGPRRDSGPPCVIALPVDILWVIDNSDSMREEQTNLTINFPTLIEALTQPPDLDRDGMPDWLPVEDLRMGVVTTDLGTAPHSVPGCSASGDGAALLSATRSIDPSCAGVTLAPSPWLEYHAGDDRDQLARRFACMARVGTGGCGLEQQLEAARRAITEETAPGRPNEGFLRSDSLLAIIFVTDEEDCSASNPGALFDPSATPTLGPYGTRCAFHPEHLHDVARYVSAFAGLRLDRRGDVVVAALTGVPFVATADPLSVDYDMLLADPRMTYGEDPGRPGQLAPACETMTTGRATPARRIVELVRQFAATDDGLAVTICEEDLSPALTAIGRLIARRICPPPI